MVFTLGLSTICRLRQPQLSDRHACLLVEEDWVEPGNISQSHSRGPLIPDFGTPSCGLGSGWTGYFRRRYYRLHATK